MKERHIHKINLTARRNSSGRTSMTGLQSKKPLTRSTSKRRRKQGNGKRGTFASHSRCIICDSWPLVRALRTRKNKCPRKLPRPACSSAPGWTLSCTASLLSLPLLRLLLPMRPLPLQFPLPETSCVASLPVA